MSYILTIKRKTPRVKHSTFVIPKDKIDIVLKHLETHGEKQEDKKKPKEEKVEKKKELSLKDKIIRELKKPNRDSYYQIGLKVGLDDNKRAIENRISKIAIREKLGKFG